MGTSDNGDDTLVMMMCFTYDSNFTQPVGPPPNFTTEELVYPKIKSISNNLLLPAIFLFGCIGNILNIVIFTRSRYRHTLDDIEKSATAGLIALALSDLLFCAIGFPDPFVTSGSHSGRRENVLEVVSLYYRSYKTSLMNVFLFSSTWLIVAIAIERYVAVCYPFHARWLISLKRTVSCHVCIFILSICMNIPNFLKWDVKTVQCPDGTTSIYMAMSEFYRNQQMREAYQLAWAAFGAFLPLVLLTLCNTRLLIEVYRSRARYSTDRHRYTTSKVTVILIAIIVLYLVMVCPSIMLTYFSNMFSRTGKIYYIRYQIALTVTNVTQAINFAMNFILYCAVSKPFRDNLKGQMCKSKAVSRSSTDQTNRYQLVDVHM